MALVGEYLTVKQAARFLGVADNTMRHWDAVGVVPVHRHPTNNYCSRSRERMSSPA